jgi:hypothetical protein
MFQATDVSLDPGAKRFRSAGVIHMNAVRQGLEIQVVLTTSLVQTEKQHDGNLEQRSEQEWPFRKHPWRTQELAGHAFFVIEQAVA